MNKVVFAVTEDWVGIYINGTLLKEDHCFEADDVAEILFANQPFEKPEFREIDEEWLEKKQWKLPQALKQVKFE